MSSITPANIAGSIAQGTLQQSQAARPGDAQRREATRQARRADQRAQEQLESVGDSYETSDDHLVVDEEGRGHQGQHMPARRKAEESEDSEDSEERRPDMKGQRLLPYAEGYGDEPDTLPPQLDVTA